MIVAYRNETVLIKLCRSKGTNHIALFPFIWFSVLFARFHVKVIRKSLHLCILRARLRTLTFNKLQHPFKALYHKNWKRNMNLETIGHSRTLRSCETINLVVQLERITFRTVRLNFSTPYLLQSNLVNFGSFSKQTFNILKERSIV